MYIAPFIHIFFILPFGINECFAIRQNQPHHYQRMRLFIQLNPIAIGSTKNVEEPKSRTKRNDMILTVKKNVLFFLYMLHNPYTF